MATGLIFHCVGCGAATNIRDPEAEGNCCDACWLAPSERSSAPAWLDAPDGPGWHWEKFASGICMTEIVEHDGVLSARYWDGDEPPDPCSKWQRVAPPREG